KIRCELGERHASQSQRSNTGRDVDAGLWLVEVDRKVWTRRRTQSRAERAITPRALERKHRQFTFLSVHRQLEPIGEERPEPVRQLGIGSVRRLRGASVD